MSGTLVQNSGGIPPYGALNTTDFMADTVPDIEEPTADISRGINMINHSNNARCAPVNLNCRDIARDIIKSDRYSNTYVGEIS